MTGESGNPGRPNMEGREIRLKRAREFAGFGTATDAARRFTWKEPTYRSHENGIRDFKIDQAKVYAESFGVSVDWLFYGRGQAPARATQASTQVEAPPPANGVIVTTASNRPVGKLPVYGMAKAGDQGAIVWTDAPRDYIDRPGSLEDVPDAYGVYVVGDSMENRYFEGEAVHVNPAKPARRGDFVVAQVIDPHTGETVALVKRLVTMNSDTVVLAQLNPPREFTFRRADVHAVHRIVGLTSE